MKIKTIVIALVALGFTGAAMAGHSVRALSDNVKARLGGIAARQMLSLGVQTAKMREHFAVLFRDIKVEGFLKALQTITSLFSQSTASGRALKTLAETILQPLIDGFDYLAPIAKRFFQGMVLGLQFVTIQVLKAGLWLKKAFGGSDLLKGIDLTTVALYAGEAAVALIVTGLVAAVPVVIGLAVALGTWLVPVLISVAAGLASIAAGALLAAAPFVLGAAAVGLLAYNLYKLYKIFGEIDWSELGTAIVDGIVNGLKRGASWVIDTVKNLGKGAYKAFKSALGIASPSKEFAKLGVEIPRGLQQGIKAGTPSAQSDVESMIAVPDEPRSGSARGGRTITIQVGDVHVHTNARDAQGIGQSLKAELERIFEGVAVQLGAPTPGGA